MNFFNDEIHEEMLGLYRDFATGVCAPIAAEIDEEEKFPVESFKQAAEMGLMGIPFPEEYGGAGLDELSRFHSSRHFCSHIPLRMADLQVRYRRAEAEISSSAAFRREARRFRSD